MNAPVHTLMLHTLITVYGSHIPIPHVFHTVFHMFFLHDFQHVTQVNHLGIYMGILYTFTHKSYWNAV